MAAWKGEVWTFIPCSSGANRSAGAAGSLVDLMLCRKLRLAVTKTASCSRTCAMESSPPIQRSMVRGHAYSNHGRCYRAAAGIRPPSLTLCVLFHFQCKPIRTSAGAEERKGEGAFVTRVPASAARGTMSGSSSSCRVASRMHAFCMSRPRHSLSGRPNAARRNRWDCTPFRDRRRGRSRP